MYKRQEQLYPQFTTDLAWETTKASGVLFKKPMECAIMIKVAENQELAAKDVYKRQMDNHFEVMWDMLHSIPSLETEGASVLDEYYWLNKEDPNFSLCLSLIHI